MRFFADHCVPRSVIRGLEAQEHEVFELRGHLPTDASDEQVIEEARQLQVILISLNGDFADIVRYPPAEYGGIVALQVRNRPEVIPEIVDRLTRYLSKHPEPSHYQGKLLLVEAHRLRIRK